MAHSGTAHAWLGGSEAHEKEEAREAEQQGGEVEEVRMCVALAKPEHSCNDGNKRKEHETRPKPFGKERHERPRFDERVDTVEAADVGDEEQHARTSKEQHHPLPSSGSIHQQPQAIIVCDHA